MIHWISNSRISLQRLGFCRLAVLVCQAASSRTELSERARELVQTSITVEASGEFARWARRRPKGRGVTGKGNEVTLRLQDRWVFEHPSQSGWLLDLAHEEYYEKMGLPFLLGLLDDECNQTDLGELLAHLDTEAVGNWTVEKMGNPLILTPENRVAFLYAIMRSDGDFMIPYVHDLLRFDGRSFTYLEAGQSVPAVMGRVLARLESAVYTSEDQERFHDMELAKEKIAENIEKNVETKGSGSRREQTVLPRLEWLVDLGVLDRTCSGAREYILCQGSAEFIQALHRHYANAADSGYPEEAVEKVVDRNFFALAHRLLYGLHETDSPDDIVNFILPAYDEMRSPTGYCVGHPLLLLAHIRRWEAGEHTVIEYETAKAVLEEAYQHDPDRFYFTTARFGEDFQIKIEQDG